jgi:catechol 2,3-dioxygenase-like lactoylglutathione lyase family enzyme
MPKAIAFYRDLLGFEVVSTDLPGNECGWALLKLNDTEIMLNTLYERDERPPVRNPVVVQFEPTRQHCGSRRG